MTSLSRIYRPGVDQEMPNIRTIEIRELIVPTVGDDEEVIPDVSLEQVYAERDRLLAEAAAQIEAERAQFAAQCDAQQAALAEAQAAWEEEKIQLQQQAYEEGFAQGMEDGRQKALDNMAKDIQIANDTMAQSEQNALAYLERQEGVILQLAIRSAERILNDTLAEDATKFVGVIQRALKEVRESEFVKIYVSASNHQLLTENRNELVAMFPPDMPFMIFIDDALSDTESYIDTNHGRLMASIDAQLNELRHHLGEILENVE
jgi:flagellar assembly protein FliH